MDEENTIALGDIQHWHNPDYQLRIEEAERLIDLLNQLSLTLNGPFICIPDIRVGGFVKMIKEAIPDWSRPPQDLTVRASHSECLAKLLKIFTKTCFAKDCSLQYYINLSRACSNLRGILYVTLIGGHYILLEHLYSENQIIGHNSMGRLSDRIQDAYASYNTTNQCILTAFLGKTWSAQMVRNHNKAYTVF